jgi:hypothetical protein
MRGNRLNPLPVPADFTLYGQVPFGRRPLPGRVTLSILRRVRLAYSCYLSKPQSDRPVYRAIRRCHARKIVELGIATGQRTMQMIEVAKLSSPGQEIHYVGVDPFEGRSDSDRPGLTLKAAHQLLRRDGVRVQLVPGNLADSLARLANSLGKVDLLIVPAALESASFARTWFFVPRMLHEQSLVFVEQTFEDGQMLLEIKPRYEINVLASMGVRRQAA